MRAFSVACLIVVLAARAEAQRVEYMHVAVPGYQRVVKLDTAVIWTRVDTPAPETYHALRLALEELKIPVVLADSAHFFIYNATVRMSRRISGEDMTWAFRCGQSPTGIDYATSARMTIAYAIVVDTLPEGESRVGAAFVAGAQPVDGASRAPLPCETTGALEQRLIEVARLVPVTGK
ncbi:MAG TPA: hypothetical protein VKH19_20120 [Gemmatimonadaceae bacterium]|nr:hypothetical protein [Gemmatimonadaceae bacterium]